MQPSTSDNKGLLIEKIHACSQSNQQGYRFISSTVAPEGPRPGAKLLEPVDTDIEIEVFPSSNQKNIVQINGHYQGRQCLIDRDELHGLPLRVNGVGGNLADKLSFQLKGEVDKKGKFNLFVTGLATTLVKFKLWGDVFPDVERPADALTPELFKEEVFRRLKRQYQSTRHGNPGLDQWIKGMTDFWDKWHPVFQMDLQADVLRRFEDVNQTLEQLQASMNQFNQRLLAVEKKLEKVEQSVNNSRKLTLFR